MSRSRYAFIALLTVIIYTTSYPGYAQSGDRFYDRTFAFEPGDLLAVATSSDDIVIRRGAGNEARVEIYGSGRDAREAFERLDVAARREGDRLIVEVKRRDRGGWFNNRRASFDVVVTAPERLDLNIATSSGDIAFGEITGSGEIASSSGDIEFDVHRGPLTVSTSSGDVEGDRVEGRFEASTSSGDVSIGRVSGPAVTFSASSGDFEAELVESDRFTASTSSGDLSVGTLLGSAELRSSSGDVEIDALEGALSASTSSGDVEATFSKASPVGPVEVSTGSGGVTLRASSGLAADVELAGGSIRIDRAFQFAGEVQRRSAEGQLGNGGPLLKVSTGSGSIALAAR